MWKCEHYIATTTKKGQESYVNMWPKFKYINIFIKRKWKMAKRDCFRD